MERRDKYGLNLNGMSIESLTEFIDTLEAEKDRIDTFLTLAWEKLRSES
jgi:hypothetical protein